MTRHLYVEPADRQPGQPVPSNSQFWEGMRVDLAGATLINLEFTGRRTDIADFRGARFVGGTNFAYAEFVQHVYFQNARFDGGPGHFYRAQFGLRAIFIDTDFGTHEAYFDHARFAGMTLFRGTKFDGGVRCNQAQALRNFNTSWGTERERPPGWAACFDQASVPAKHVAHEQSDPLVPAGEASGSTAPSQSTEDATG